ncbi:sortase-dependent protein [Streptomyces sp. NPDC006527]|uniref:sortase-dependent protein n=1 Tax=Streptomyces sp. NPDC006527 TaxID=3364749 RepID=UPI0036A5816B
MPRTGLATLAVAGAAVMLGAVPASADGTDATPAPAATAAPARDAASAAPARDAASAAPTRDAASAAPAPAATTAPTPVPEPAEDATPVPGQVSVVPRGAADTGAVADPATTPSGLVAGSAAAAVFAAGGAGVYVVRRRWATRA